MVDAIPVVDFSAYSLDRDSPDQAGFQQLVVEVHNALTTVGFMCLRNFGVRAQKVESLSKQQIRFCFYKGVVKANID